MRWQRQRFGGRIVRLAEVTPKLRTASPAEVDRPPHHEEPVSSANSGIDVRARGFYQVREGGRLWI